MVMLLSDNSKKFGELKVIVGESMLLTFILA
jgi:hypothetical protein